MSKEVVLVTGAAGYIGSLLCHGLLASGRKVIALDNMSHNQPSLMGLANMTGFEFIRGDARNYGLVINLKKRADTIIPLAAIVGVAACNLYRIEAETTNKDAVVLATQKLSKDQRVIYPNTNSAYGKAERMVTEESPTNPLTFYARTKMAGEEAALEAVDTISLRLATVFGPSPRMRFDLMVNNFVWLSMTQKMLIIYQPKARRNFIHALDVVDGILFCLDKWDSMEKGIYNLGNDSENCTKQDLALKMTSVFSDVQLKIGDGKDPDSRDYIVSSKKLAEAGFRAKKTVRTGIFQIRQAVHMLPRPGYLNTPEIGDKYYE